jgi:hypothetical protein
LSGHASGDAKSDAERSTDGLWFHFVLMVTAEVWDVLCTAEGGSGLLSGEDGSKVKETYAATGAHSCAGRRT